MEKYKAIPEGYMTIGEIAKKMGVTVRTLQYYDKEGILLPSNLSKGGRRLYSDKDIVKLYRILAFKQLGFSLEDIKGQLSSIDSPAGVSAALKQQADCIRKNIENLTHSLRELELLNEEVLQMQTVDFRKYAAIIVNLKMHNELYYLVKHMDSQVLDHMNYKFDDKSSLAFIQAQNQLFDKIERCQNEGYLPSSDQVQVLVKEFWDMILDITDGDMSILSKLMGMLDVNEEDSNWAQRKTMLNDYVGPALDIYFTNLGINPLEEE